MIMPTYSIEVADALPVQADAFESPDFDHALAVLIRVAGESLIHESHGGSAISLFRNFDLMDEKGLILYSLSVQGFRSAAMGQLR
ncbi:hypothetical protein N4G62_13805 [Sphingomonas sanguinis]|uniref:Uncharacterized protein n=1 Tax=Sphingomonas sanguinis TaxID=33051 RepID=A0ABU5LT40_9SPHN|nr:hypothetical protein [Sphingomonas sanguinis]MDZ7283098.1 hypothetical protein [Sphingomonas sanguinis]